MRKSIDEVAEQIVNKEKERLTMELTGQLMDTCKYPIRYGKDTFEPTMDQKVISPQLFMFLEKPGTLPVCIANGNLGEIAWHLANIFKQNPQLWDDINDMYNMIE
jgi:hypothetical protein